MIDAIVFPERFFEEPRADNLSVSALVVLFAAIANIVGTVVLVSSSWSTITDGGTVVTTTYLLSIVFGFGGGFISWILYAASFHVLSAVFGGEGEFRTVVTYVGWGFIPSILAGLGNAIAIGFSVQGARFPTDPARLGPFVERLTSGPLFFGIELLDLALLFWSGVVWVFAVRNARNISTIEAAISVAIPVSIALFFTM